jgi:hypothetical protein
MSNSRIINISNISVVIEDIRVYLPGKGDSDIVNTELVNRSKDFRDVRSLVRVEEIKTDKSMPVWPFHKSLPKLKEAPQEDTGSIKEDVRIIKELLTKLLSRPSAPPAEVVAAHMRVAQERQELLKAGTLPLPMQDPMFVPSSIIPDDAEAVIKTKETEITKDDFDGNVEALKKALKGS